MSDVINLQDTPEVPGEEKILWSNKSFAICFNSRASYAVCFAK